ncbi:MATH and LRR domain-containing protein PFE0570w-like isoform X2 [Condylostylus longicornis]|uniref:MATH and LRR domain-containing protein PFE0570w-like isoform X2 n=1 Tax=Condylostylus longicornis TaxID=2530218 RepID=UPI00244DED7E|nr:MATH and LRR domain-containing protein PFE0570w-like isoform X2 [Condylostylus longicornis]
MEDKRFANLKQDLPFLEMLVSNIKNSLVGKIIDVIKNNEVHSTVTDERLTKMKNIVEQLKKKHKISETQNKVGMDTSEKLKIKKNEGKILDYIDLESSDDDEKVNQNKSNNVQKNEDSSDEEIEFYEVQNSTSKTNPPNPVKTSENVIKVEKDKDLDSDLEIISDSEDSFQIKSVKSNKTDIEIEFSNHNPTDETKKKLDSIKKEEKSLFTRRNDRNISEKLTDKSDSNESRELLNEKKENIPISKNIKDTNIIELEDSDDESDHSHTESLLSMNSTEMNEIVENLKSEQIEKIATNGRNKSIVEIKDLSSKQVNKLGRQDVMKSPYSNINKKAKCSNKEISSSKDKILDKNMVNEPLSNNNEVLSNENDIIMQLVQFTNNLEKGFSSLIEPNTIAVKPKNRDPRLNKHLNNTIETVTNTVPANVNSQIMLSKSNVKVVSPICPVLAVPSSSISSQQQLSVSAPIISLQQSLPVQASIIPIQQPMPVPPPLIQLQQPPSNIEKLPMVVIPPFRKTNHPQNPITVPPPPSYHKEDIISALEKSEMLPNQNNGKANNLQNNNSKPIFTTSKQTYGEYLRQRDEAKLRAEKEAYERGLRQAEQLGLYNSADNIRNKQKQESNPPDKEINSAVPTTSTNSKVVDIDKGRKSENNEKTIVNISTKPDTKASDVNSENNNEEKNNKTKFVKKKGRITVLSDSSSENEDEFVKEPVLKNKSNENKGQNELNPNNTIALLKIFTDYLVEKQILDESKIESLLKDEHLKKISTQNEKSVITETKKTQKCDIIDQIETKEHIPEKVKRSRRVSKKSTTKSHANVSDVANDKMSRELEKLHEQIDGFYDRDEILAAAGKHRASSKLALQKMKNKTAEQSPNDDESSTDGETHTNIITLNKSTTEDQICTISKAKSILPLRKSCYVQISNNISDPKFIKKNNYNKNDKAIEIQSSLSALTSAHYELQNIITNEKSNIIAKDDDYDTDDFSSHLKEKKIKKKLNKKLISNSVVPKRELKIILKRLTPEEISLASSTDKVPVLKPLSVVPALSHSQTDRSRKKNNFQLKEDMLNTNTSHHCKNKEFMKKCILCNKSPRDIVSHYVNLHSNESNSEVYCARLPNIIVEKFKYEHIIGKLLEKNPFKYEVDCIFCGDKIFGFHTELYEHYAQHTGEFAWQCNSCNKKFPSKKDVLKHCKTSCVNDSKPLRIYVYNKESKIIATFCAACNFIQLNKANIIRHLQNHHFISKEPEKLCEMLVLVEFSKSSSTTRQLCTSYSSIDVNLEDFCDNNSNVYDENEINMIDIEEKVKENISSNAEQNFSTATNDNDIDIKPMVMEELNEIFCETSTLQNGQNETEEDNIENDVVDIRDDDDDIIYIDSGDDESDATLSINSDSNFISVSDIQHESTPYVHSKGNCPLKPWLNDCCSLDKSKSKTILANMDLSNFFKCIKCKFSTNADDQMLNHLKKHRLDNLVGCLSQNSIEGDQFESRNNEENFECCYCGVKSKDPSDLIFHIKSEHEGSNVQCSKCFYRSCSIFSVKLHIKMFHQNDGKIIICEGTEIPVLKQFEIMLEKRQQHLKPFECHLCKKGENTKFYLKNDYEKHFKTMHRYMTIPSLNNRGMLCCLYCTFETNLKQEIGNHMANYHPNREQYVAFRFRNPKFNKKKSSSTPDSTFLVDLSESVLKSNFIDPVLANKKRTSISASKSTLRSLADKKNETIRSIKNLSNDLAVCCDSQENEQCTEFANTLESCQNELYEMAKLAVFHTGFIESNLYVCPMQYCKLHFNDYENWFNHVKSKHPAILNLKFRCPHCPNLYATNEFKEHFDENHLKHKYFCYICGTSAISKDKVENHFQEKHQVSDTICKLLLPNNKYTEEFFVVLPTEANCDNKTLILHMKNILIKVPHKNLSTKEKSVILPKFVALESERYKCPEKNCSWTTQSEKNLEEHFKYIHKTSKSFKCLHCSFHIDEGNRDFDRVKDHLRIHGEILYVCTKCRFFDHQRQIVQKHIRTIHKLHLNMTKIVRSFRNDVEKCVYQTCLEEGHIFLSLSFCPICEEDLKDPDKIVDHLKSQHSVDVIFECQYCKGPFTKLDYVIGHINKDHDKVLNIRCNFEYIKKSTFDQTNIQNQTEVKSVKENISFSTNNKRTRTEDNAKADYLQIKKTKIEDSTTESERKSFHVYVCEECTFESFTRSDLITHKTQVHSNNLDSSIASSSTYEGSNNKNQINCQHCKFKCNTQEALNEHQLIENHVNDKVTYRCNNCSNNFENLMDLKLHNLMEHNELLAKKPQKVIETDLLQREKIYHCEFCENYKVLRNILETNLDQSNVQRIPTIITQKTGLSHKTTTPPVSTVFHQNL